MMPNTNRVIPVPQTRGLPRAGSSTTSKRIPSLQEAALNRAIGTGNHHAGQLVRKQEAIQQRQQDSSISFGL